MIAGIAPCAAAHGARVQLRRQHSTIRERRANGAGDRYVHLGDEMMSHRGRAGGHVCAAQMLWLHAHCLASIAAPGAAPQLLWPVAASVGIRTAWALHLLKTHHLKTNKFKRCVVGPVSDRSLHFRAAWRD